MAQLRMHLDAAHIDAAPAPQVPDGFLLRTFRPHQDEAPYVALMQTAFAAWNEDYLQRTLRAMLPDGLFFVVDAANGALAGTAVANRIDPNRFPDGGEFGWLVVAPAYQGRRLSRVVHDAVVRRYRDEGYRHLYLLTDDFRLPALRLYLTRGWTPIIPDDETARRWHAIYEKLGLPEPQ